MKLFKRNYNDKTVDGDYLKSADTVSRPTAILYILLIILVISAVVFCLFVSGKWIYKTVTSKDKSTTTQSTSENNVDKSTTDNSASGSNSTNQNSNTNGTNQSTPTPAQTPTKIPNTGPEDE
jgi:uncharacterized protein YxeA